jgi:tungstate transport system ATP-binding protein
MSQSEIILEARNIQVIRGGTLLLDVPSLSIREGEIFSLIGPNGAGKTTLMQTLSFLQKPFEGEISFRGRTVNSNHSVIEYRRRLAMVFQEPLLFDTTVFDNIASGLKIRRMRKQQIHRVVGEQLERFGIASLSRRSARTLSGGEAQRTSLARAFAIQPEVLFLDEPFASLDPPSRESLIEDLENVLRQTRTTALFATHDRQEALRLSDRIAVMKGGKILQIGSPGEVTQRPANEFIASFVGVETILTGRVIRKGPGIFVASVQDREIVVAGEAHPGEGVVLCIRPENVVLLANRPLETTSARNVFEGTVERVIPLGFFQRVHLNCGFPLAAFVTNQSVEHLSIREGKEMVASFKATAIHVIRKGEDREQKGRA